MNTKLIELRMAVRALPTDSEQVQLAVKAEVLRIAELLDKQERETNSAVVGFTNVDGYLYVIPAESFCVRCGLQQKDHPHTGCSTFTVQVV